MSISYDLCRHCGQAVIKGAMRCLGCGKILKTAEEQAASIKKLRKSAKKSRLKSLMNIIIFFVLLIVLYHFFSDKVHELISQLF